MQAAVADAPLQASQARFGPGPHLTEEQIVRYKSALVKGGVPVRFLHNGGALNIISGHVQPRGINVIHQCVYWNFTRETAQEIAKLLDVRAVFSE
jgi:hypothetical protein